MTTRVLNTHKLHERATDAERQGFATIQFDPLEILMLLEFYRAEKVRADHAESLIIRMGKQP